MTKKSNFFKTSLIIIICSLICLSSNKAAADDTFSDASTEIYDWKKTYDTWQQGFSKIFNYILENKEFVLNTYNSVSREYLERYLYNETYLLLIGVVDEKSKGITVRDKDKSFIADFYKYAFVGLVIDWIRKGMREDPNDIIQRLNILISGNIEKALEGYRTDKSFKVE